MTSLEVAVRLGGRFEGDDVRLTLEEDRVTGRFSGRISGKDVALRREGGRLEGRIGGAFDGKDIRLDPGAVPLELAALTAVCADKVLEHDEAATSASHASS